MMKNPIAYALLTNLPHGPLVCREVRYGDGKFDHPTRLIKPLYEQDVVDEAKKEAALFQEHLS
jgi:hypothetical protein